MPHISPKILVVSGSTQLNSRTYQLCALAAQTAQALGAEVRVINLHTTRLPLFEGDSSAQNTLPAVVEIRESARWANGLILGTPEYHGAIGGALKNWLDFLYDELAGKLAGVLAVTGGTFGGDMSVTATKNSVHWCHGFTLPFHVAARPSDFHEGLLTDPRTRERVQRLAHDIVRYAPLINAAFEEARALGSVVEAGFAGLHVEDDDDTA